ncbi:MAG: SulP family inorganic anion transporter [Hyphomicrobiaceae bacterium]|nr:SulP family inorganic anion transporter [Hyphomicrobiaceae bacterium]
MQSLGQRLGWAGAGHTMADGWREAMTGIVASLVTLAHCLSFSALIFAGELKSGFPSAFWGFLVATVAVSLLAGTVTTLPPMLAGPRNPAIAVMSVLATTVSAAAATAGLDAAEAARHVLIALAIAGLLTGIGIWALGYFRLGQIVRFVPFPVIAGFLAASGWLLIVGGAQVAIGSPMRLASGMPAVAAPELVRLAAAVAFAALLIGLRRARGGTALLPVAIVGATIALGVVLWLTGSHDGWYLASGGGATVGAWSPLASLGGLDWSIIGGAGVEIVSIAAVSMVALLLDITSLEVQRRAAADMDAEFRSIGAANLAAFAIGGLPVGHALNPSRLIDALGGRARIAGLAGGAAMGLVLVSGIDIAAMVPRPVLGGLLFFLGLGVLAEALKAPGRRSWIELALSLAIMAAIVWLGYLTGIVLGLIGACLLFAASYSRIGVVRRHVTRASFAAPVERAPEALRRLAEEGDRIHVLWLAGFIFFGSSNGLYEEIRRVTGRGSPGRPRWVVLDCGRVSGIDASALLSLEKLVNWAAAADVVLVFAGLSPTLAAELAEARIADPGKGMPVFATRNEALEWCEDGLLAGDGAVPTADGPAELEGWLSIELGGDQARRLIDGYLERRDLAVGEVVCALGAPSDTIELVATGSVAVMVPGHGERPIRVRRMTGRTVVGEMGFFRELPRAASVVAEEPTVVYLMTRSEYRRLQAEEPELCARFLEFVVRALANRVDVANREITALI